MSKRNCINKLTEHKYYECSDLPRLCHIGIFSCSACDIWRERIHSRGNGKSLPQRRDFLSDRHQCRREKLGMGPIRIRVVYNTGDDEKVNEADHSNKENIAVNAVVAVDDDVVRKDRRATAVIKKLEDLKVLQMTADAEKQRKKEQANAARKNKDRHAMNILMQLEASKKARLSEQLAVVQQENDNLKLLVKETESELAANRMKLEMVKDRLVTASNALAEHQKDLKSKKVLIQYYKKKEKCAATSDMVTCVEASNVCNAIEMAFLFLKGKHNTTKAKVLVEAIMSGKLFKGEAARAVSEVMRQFIRSLFRPWKLVKAGDISSVGSVKTSTINALRNVVDEAGVGYFPSASAVNRARALLDDHGMEVVGYQRRDTKYGEVYYLNFENAFRLLLKACKLDKLAETTSVKVALTVDGAALIKNRTHVSTGIKITDERGVHPISGQPFMLHDAENDENMYVKVQTSEVCCAMVIADAIDNKHLYEDVFREYYEWGEKLRLEGLPESNKGPKLMPFNVTHAADMKAAWYLSNKGGGCKTKTFFCHLCCCTKNSLVAYKMGNSRCLRCKARHKAKCYHHEVCDTVRVKDMLQDLEQQLGLYFEKHKKTYQDIQSQSRLRTDHMQVDKEEDLNHLDYVIPVDNPEKQRQYTQFIARECRLRDISLHGTQVEEWRSLLRSSVAIEKYIYFLEQVRKWNEMGRETVPLVEVVELLIPCILHLENRISEKIITIILRKGLDEFQGRKEDYISTMESIFQKKVLGTEDHPAHYRLYYERNSDGNVALEPIQVKNNVARCIIQEIDAIIEAALPSGHSSRSQLIIAMSKYRELMKLLTLHRELSEEEIEKFQDLADDFFEIWIDIFGEEGVTNYIHMLGSGHITYFLRRYGCLYLYSQQGWEALNSTIQTFIMQNSQRGGHGSGENGKKSYIYPLVRMIVRDLLWKTYEADKFFLDLESRGKPC
jgi:hypothetical protein